jgi:hypothetical protein
MLRTGGRSFRPSHSPGAVELRSVSCATSTAAETAHEGTKTEWSVSRCSSRKIATAIRARNDALGAHLHPVPGLVQADAPKSTSPPLRIPELAGRTKRPENGEAHST